MILQRDKRQRRWRVLCQCKVINSHVCTCIWVHVCIPLERASCLWCILCTITDSQPLTPPPHPTRPFELKSLLKMQSEWTQRALKGSQREQSGVMTTCCHQPMAAGEAVGMSWPTCHSLLKMELSTWTTELNNKMTMTLLFTYIHTSTHPGSLFCNVNAIFPFTSWLLQQKIKLFIQGLIVL